jgi:hypothetical protein
LKRLGEVGSRSSISGCKNIIGKCAEIKSANGLLSVNHRTNEKEIEFTSAIRPRTLERIPRCANCVHVFGPEK